MTNSRLEIDALVGWMGIVNLRTEKHGEDDVEAIDVPITLHAGENGEQWEMMLGLCYGMTPDDAHEKFLDEAILHRRLLFSREYAEHRVHVWQGNEKLATLNPCNINKFDVIFADSERGDALKFRLQCNQVNGAMVGRLSERMRQLIRLEILGPDQSDLVDAG